MTYAQATSRIDAGVARGPRRGLLFHMAEGSGTVGYLSGVITKTRNPRRVSVHGVIELSGRFVQMLDWSHMHTSLNPDDRSTDKTYFGKRYLESVLGDWAYAGATLGPNHATLAVEIEGFASNGPNAAQVATAIAWGGDMRGRFPSLRGALGHADQTNTKACPGSSAPMRAIFDTVGGHGLWPAPKPPEVPVLTFDIDPAATTGTVTVATTGHSYVNLETGALSPHIVPPWEKSPAFGPVKLTVPIPGGTGDRATGYLIGTRAAFILAADCTFAADDVAALQAKVQKAIAMLTT